MDTIAKIANKIKKSSDKTIFSRGYDYYIKGRVGEILRIENIIKANVIGTRCYSVTITLDGSNVQWKCTCPYEGLCKHIIAVSLLLNDNVSEIDTAKIKEYLLSKSENELAEIILNHGISDIEFVKSLAVEANLYKENIDTSFFKKQINSLMDRAYDLEYANVYEYVEGLKKFLNQLKPLIKKFPKEIAEILYYFIVQSIDIFDNAGIDDSDGKYGSFIISLGEPFSESVKRSNYVISPKDFVDTYFKAASYGLEDCFYSVIMSLPEENLEKLELYARENFNRVKDVKESWRSINQRYFLAVILALLGKKKDYIEVCKGDKNLLEEIKDIERQMKL